MRNILVRLRYIGTNYCGFSIQKNGVTVQQVFQKALDEVVGHQTMVKGCSRTDSGVHALSYALSFHTHSDIDCGNLARALNVKLPVDISVICAKEVDIAFHARYNVLEKEYVYLILNTPVRDPFWHGRSLYYRHLLDISVLNDAAKHFVGTHDFSAFMSKNSGMEDTVRTVSRADIVADGQLVKVYLRADGFLYNMVRIIVGTLLRVAEGKILAGEIPSILAGQDRGQAGPTARPEGLYLNCVFYPGDIDQKEE